MDPNKKPIKTIETSLILNSLTDQPQTMQQILSKLNISELSDGLYIKIKLLELAKEQKIVVENKNGKLNYHKRNTQKNLIDEIVRNNIKTEKRYQENLAIDKTNILSNNNCKPSKNQSKNSTNLQTDLHLKENCEPEEKNPLHYNSDEIKSRQINDNIILDLQNMGQKEAIHLLMKVIKNCLKQNKPALKVIHGYQKGTRELQPYLRANEIASLTLWH